VRLCYVAKQVRIPAMQVKKLQQKTAEGRGKREAAERVKSGSSTAAWRQQDMYCI
jgi:hypothetical protein